MSTHALMVDLPLTKEQVIVLWEDGYFEVMSVREAYTTGTRKVADIPFKEFKARIRELNVNDQHAVIKIMENGDCFIWGAAKGSPAPKPGHA
jgi:hypothetical protein